VLDQFALHTGLFEVCPYPQRSLPSGGAQADEVLHIAAIIHQLLIAQPVDHVRSNARGVSLFDQFAAQLRGAVIAPRQRIEANRSRGARIVGGDPWLTTRVAPGVTPP
jgi:hypothetical protein